MTWRTFWRAIILWPIQLSETIFCHRLGALPGIIDSIFFFARSIISRPFVTAVAARVSLPQCRGRDRVFRPFRESIDGLIHVYLYRYVLRILRIAASHHEKRKRTFDGLDGVIIFNVKTKNIDVAVLDGGSNYRDDIDVFRICHYIHLSRATHMYTRSPDIVYLYTPWYICIPTRTASGKSVLWCCAEGASNSREDGGDGGGAQTPIAGYENRFWTNKK